MRYLLDTNICIYLIQQRAPRLVERCESLAYGEAVLSAVVWAELRHGAERDPSTRLQALAALDRLLEFFPVLPFGQAAAHRYGVLRAASPSRRRDAFDTLIAAHAISGGLTLVTNNERDFQDYDNLVIENWTVEP